MATQTPDALFLYHGTICLIEAKNDLVADWLKQRLPREALCSARVWWVEDAAVLPLRDEMQTAGLLVAVSQQGPTH